MRTACTLRATGGGCECVLNSSASAGLSSLEKDRMRGREEGGRIRSLYCRVNAVIVRKVGGKGSSGPFCVVGSCGGEGA